MRPRYTSAIRGFYQLPLAQRRDIVARQAGLSDAETAAMNTGGLSVADADLMIENVIGRFALPFGIATNFQINGIDRLVPMVVEEASVVAACSYAAKLFRAGGGINAHSDASIMTGQIQLLDIRDMDKAAERLRENKTALLECANKSAQGIARRGGGAVDIELRRFPDTAIGDMIVLHLYFDALDAMGANAINTALESIAPLVESITGGRVNLRILSNLCDRRKAYASGTIPADALATKNASRGAVVDAIIEAAVFAEIDPYRAATHNKGIMNGVDALLLATGNDWRAAEAGAHAYAARAGPVPQLDTLAKRRQWRFAWRDRIAVGDRHRRRSDALASTGADRPEDSRRRIGAAAGGGGGGCRLGAEPGGNARLGHRRHPARPHASACPAASSVREKAESMSNQERWLMQPDREVGIVGYGAYIPRYRLPGSEIARIWTDSLGASPVQEKAVAGIDEDVVTMSIEAARNAINRAGVDPRDIRAIWVGSESHPYAVKPTSTIVAESIGASPNIQAADWEFACKAGTEAVQASIGIVGSGMAQYTLSIGMDTAQARPGDALEYTAASGGAAFLLGPADESLALYQGSYSYVTDTPDFWRRAGETYPSHGDRFTGEPAYFAHTHNAAATLMGMMNTTAADYAYAVFHQPNVKFPRASRQNARIPQRPDCARSLGERHRQCVFGFVHARFDRHPRYRPSGRSHPDGELWQRRRLGCF